MVKTALINEINFLDTTSCLEVESFKPGVHSFESKIKKR